MIKCRVRSLSFSIIRRHETSTLSRTYFIATRRKSVTTNPAAGDPQALPGFVARTIRRRRQLTLEQVAQQSGVSRGHLSRYERGEKLFSLGALMRLAKALGTTVSALLGESAIDDSLHVVRAGEHTLRRATGSGGSAFVTLSRRENKAGASAFIVQLGTTTVGERSFHEGDEMFYVLHGSVEIAVGSRSVRLGEGDFAEFPGMLRHWLRGLEPGTEILMVVTEFASA